MKRALLIGLNYKNSDYSLSCCENEVAYEADGHGFFTGSLIKHWDSGNKYVTQLMPLIYKDVQADQHPVHIKVNTTGLKLLF